MALIGKKKPTGVWSLVQTIKGFNFEVVQMGRIITKE